ncbi:transglutaminase family protein [Prosthecobacter sp.]|uniref:transglutaminase family protein n=1 Tax=Prosthecobacter sp. TaxID=1965333 RepID=UPI003782E960
MILDASCHLEYETSEEVSAIFMLRPRSGWAQWIMQEDFVLKPRVPVVEYTDLYGNICQRLIMPRGSFHFSMRCRAWAPNDLDSDPLATLQTVAQLPVDLLHYLLPSRYCQSDKLGAIASSIIGTTPRTHHQIMRIRTWIHENITYARGSSDSSTSALETVNTRRGVCRDFAHLGIALCRAINVPARMVVGFVHRLDPMDLHAWFEAYIGGRWYTFDATEDKPGGGRIVVAYGRDAADVALASMFGSFTCTRMHVTVEHVVEAGD